MTNKNIIGAVVTGVAGVAAIGASICMGLNAKKCNSKPIIVETSDDGEVIVEVIDEENDEVIKEVE